MASFNPHVEKVKKSFASSNGHEPCKKPVNRVQLQLQCPRSLVENCEPTDHIWYCTKCNESIAVNSKDDHFYCACGRADRRSFAFKCSSEQHGSKFISFPEGEMNQHLKPIRELNILVIGAFEDETPTWLNAFVNYNAFSSLEEAAKGTLFTPMPLSFNIIDKNDIVQDVKFETTNANFKKENISGNVFSKGNTLIRLIDIPGIRSATHVENMKKEYQKTLSYLSSLKELHGICILLKPDAPKFDSHFELCLKELLGHFYWNITRNIVFCFTHPSGGLHQSAAMRVSLAKLQKENKLDIVLDKSTMYTIDNGVFRFVCALNKGIKFDKSNEKEFSENWISSVKETERLISYFQTIKPHKIEDTMSWVAAKKQIISLPKSIVDVLDCTDGQILALKSKLSEPKFNFHFNKPEHLGHYQMRCANSLCDSICHANCYLEDIPLGMVGNSGLRDCWAMGNGESLDCRVCGCLWNKHQLIDCTEKRESVEIVDIGGMQNIINEVEEEQQLIIESSLKIGRYLSKLAFMSYNNIIIDYIDNKCISSFNSSYNSSGFHRLAKFNGEYFKEYKLFQKAMEKPNAKELDRVEFEKLLNELCALKHYGGSLKVFIAPILNSKEEEPEVCEFEFYHDF